MNVGQRGELVGIHFIYIVYKDGNKLEIPVLQIINLGKYKDMEDEKNIYV